MSYTDYFKLVRYILSGVWHKVDDTLQLVFVDTLNDLMNAQNELDTGYIDRVFVFATEDHFTITKSVEGYLTMCKSYALDGIEYAAGAIRINAITDDYEFIPLRKK